MMRKFESIVFEGLTRQDERRRERRGLVHVIPDTIDRTHELAVVDVRFGPPFLGGRSEEIWEDGCAGPHSAEVLGAVGLLHVDIQLVASGVRFV